MFRGGDRRKDAGKSHPGLDLNVPSRQGFARFYKFRGFKAKRDVGRVFQMSNFNYKIY